MKVLYLVHRENIVWRTLFFPLLQRESLVWGTLFFPPNSEAKFLVWGDTIFPLNCRKKNQNNVNLYIATTV